MQSRGDQFTCIPASLNDHLVDDRLGPLQAIVSHGRLSLAHAIRVESAAYWLNFGDADRALRELDGLPKSAFDHPSAVKIRVGAVELLDERSGTILRE